jgi:predicted DNA-binding transcriptional regulator YafY
MVKKSNPAHKAARMLDLVPFISTHQGISLKELAAEFGVSESELTSDLNALWMCGDSRFDLIDLTFDSGFVSIRNAETLNVVRSLSPQEIVSVLIGLDILVNQLPRDRTDLVIVLEKLKSKLGKGLQQNVFAAPLSSSQSIAVIEEALATSRKISVEYYTASEDKVSQRTLIPIRLYQSEGRDFLDAYCENVQAHRTFRVDRIRAVNLLEDEASQQMPQEIETSPVAAQISIASDERRCLEKLGSKSSSSNLSVTIHSYSPAWLIRTVISSGGSMVLREPAAVRSEIAERAKSALALYD